MRIRNANSQFRILHCHYLYDNVPGPRLVGGVDNLADKGLLLASLVRVHNARHPLVSGSKMVNIMNNQSDTVGNNEKWLVFYGNAAVLATVLRYVFFHRTKGVGKVAKDRYCSPTVVMDVFFSLFI
jgi:hypothetical protein